MHCKITTVYVFKTGIHISIQLIEKYKNAFTYYFLNSFKPTTHQYCVITLKLFSTRRTNINEYFFKKIFKTQQILLSTYYLLFINH